MRIKHTRKLLLAERPIISFFSLITLLLATDTVMAISVEGLGEMLQNLQGSLGQIWTMLMAVSYMMGLFFALSAVYGLREYGVRTAFMQPQKGLMLAMIKLIVSMMLFYLPSTLNVMMFTIWGKGTDSIKSWSSTEPTWKDLGGPIINVIQVVGLVALLRGFTLLTRTGGQQTQPGTIGKAMTHIVGGILAINITGTIEIVENTFGIGS